MSELLYADRARHFNEERRLFAQYIQSVSPDATTVHATAVLARSRVEMRRQWENEASSLAERESRLSAQFDEMTGLIYRAKAAEDERVERLEFLSSLPELAEVEKDTTYYFRDLSQTRDLAQARRSSSTGKFPATKLNKPAATSRRIQTGRETKLERDLLHEIKEVNEVRTAIGRLLESIEYKSVEYSSDFSRSVAGLKAEAMRLISEAERIDQVSHGTVVELLSLRLKVMVLQREELEDAERLEGEAKYFTDKEADVHMQLNSEVSELNQKFEREVQERLRDYQRQLSSLAAHETQLLQKAEKIGGTEELPAEITALRRLEEEAKARYEKLRLRNRLEMEGFNNESLALRRRLAALEKHTKRRK